MGNKIAFKTYVDTYWAAGKDYRKKYDIDQHMLNQLAVTLNVPAGGFSDLYTAAVRWETQWVKDSRPYYNVYPAIIDMLLRLDLSRVMVKDLQPPNGLTAIIVNLPEGNRIINETTDAWHMMLSVGSCEHVSGDSIIALGWHYGEYIESIPGWDVSFMHECAVRKDGTTTLQDILELTTPKMNASECFGEQITYDATSKLLKLGAAICLIDSDSDLLLQEVLSKDVAEVVRDPNRRQHLADRARRRGKVGWTLGERVQMTPGERRPHPALYHTGKGGKIPKILMRSGCMVNRKVFEEIPTGYLENYGDSVVAKE